MSGLEIAIGLVPPLVQFLAKCVSVGQEVRETCRNGPKLLASLHQEVEQFFEFLKHQHERLDKSQIVVSRKEHGNVGLYEKLLERCQEINSELREIHQKVEKYQNKRGYKVKLTPRSTYLLWTKKSPIEELRQKLHFAKMDVLLWTLSLFHDSSTASSDQISAQITDLGKTIESLKNSTPVVKVEPPRLGRLDSSRALFKQRAASMSSVSLTLASGSLNGSNMTLDVAGPGLDDGYVLGAAAGEGTVHKFISSLFKNRKFRDKQLFSRDKAQETAGALIREATVHPSIGLDGKLQDDRSHDTHEHQNASYKECEELQPSSELASDEISFIEAGIESSPDALRLTNGEKEYHQSQGGTYTARAQFCAKCGHEIGNDDHQHVEHYVPYDLLFHHEKNCPLDSLSPFPPEPCQGQRLGGIAQAGSSICVLLNDEYVFVFFQDLLGFVSFILHPREPIATGGGSDGKEYAPRNFPSSPDSAGQARPILCHTELKVEPDSRFRLFWSDDRIHIIYVKRKEHLLLADAYMDFWSDGPSVSENPVPEKRDDDASSVDTNRESSSIFEAKPDSAVESKIVLTFPDRWISGDLESLEIPILPNKDFTLVSCDDDDGFFIGIESELGVTSYHRWQHTPSQANKRMIMGPAPENLGYHWQKHTYQDTLFRYWSGSWSSSWFTSHKSESIIVFHPLTEKNLLESRLLKWPSLETASRAQFWFESVPFYEVCWESAQIRTLFYREAGESFGMFFSTYRGQLQYIEYTFDEYRYDRLSHHSALTELAPQGSVMPESRFNYHDSTLAYLSQRQSIIVLDLKWSNIGTKKSQVPRVINRHEFTRDCDPFSLMNLSLLGDDGIGELFQGSHRMWEPRTTLQEPQKEAKDEM